MRPDSQKTADDWVLAARAFFAEKNWIGALSSARNALRLDVTNLTAWHLGCDTLFVQERHYQARRFAKAIRRFARKVGNTEEIRYAEGRIAEADEYFATMHRRLGETDLTHAAAKGDLQSVRDLLKSGAPVNEHNKYGWTALHRAAELAGTEMIRLLVESGADIESTDSLLETPLITACRFRNPKVISEFIRLGANVNHVSREKHTALWYAVYYLKDPEVVQILLDAGANPNETYEYGDNPFLLSVSAQAPAVTRLLIPLTKDLSRMNQHQVCALHFAANYDDVPLVKELLSRGVDVNQRTNWGATALMGAAEKNSLKSARILLEYGADIKMQSQYGETAISLAERRGYTEMLELLTGKG